MSLTPKLGQKRSYAKVSTFGIDQWLKQRRRGTRVLALASRESVTFLRQLSTNATLNRCRGEISHYLRARLGRPVPIRALAHCPGGVGKSPHTQVCSDGHTLYLPAETNLHSTYDQNHDHLLMLVCLETGLLEFGTFDFDRHLFLQPPVQTDESAFCPALDVYDSDLEWFVASFPEPMLAQNLLTLFEHGRIYRLTRLRYPGLHRQNQTVSQGSNGFNFGPKRHPSSKTLRPGCRWHGRYTAPPMGACYPSLFQNENRAGGDDS